MTVCLNLSVTTHGVMSKNYLPVRTNIINIQSVPIMAQELLTLQKRKNMNNVVLVESMFRVSSYEQCCIGGVYVQGVVI